MPRKPSALPPIPENIPASLRDIPQWIVWRHHWHHARQRWIKLPLRPADGEAASVAEPADWAAFDAALARYQGGGYDGLGFVFVAGGGLVGIDVDKCLDNGKPTPTATAALSIPGYAELSPSGRGLHIITRAELPRARKSDALGLELYSAARYFTITGHPVPGAACD